MAQNAHFCLILLIGTLGLSALGAQDLYRGMPEQEIYFEMKGYPTSSAESQERKILIYPNNVRLILERGKLASAQGISLLEEKPEEEDPPLEDNSSSETAAPEKTAPEKLTEAETNPPLSNRRIPSFPSENLNDPLPPEMQISPQEESRLKALVQPQEPPNPETSPETESDFSSDEVFLDDGSSGGPQAGAFLVELLMGTLITLVILKIAVGLVGVTAFLPGLIAISLTDTLVRLGLGALFSATGFPLRGPVQILVSFFVLLYLVKGFTSAREWPTIIKVVVTTKVISFVALWLLAMFVLNF